LGFSAIYITHDQTEATVLADRIVVFSEGKILQVASPKELYASPASLQIAQFLGAANEYWGAVESITGNLAEVTCGLGVVAVQGNWSDLSVGAKVHVILRPELVEIGKERPDAKSNVWPCTVERAHFLGALGTEFHVRVNGLRALVRAMHPEEKLQVGSEAWMAIHPHAISLVGGDDSD
jgi:iron(III) transport system ATP-binding protein